MLKYIPMSIMHLGDDEIGEILSKCPVCKTSDYLMFDYIFDEIKDVDNHPFEFVKFKVRCFNDSCANYHIQKEEYTRDPIQAIREWNRKCRIHNDLSIELDDIDNDEFAKIKEYLIKTAAKADNINSDAIEAINLARYSNLDLYSLFILFKVDPKEYLDELSKENK